MADNEYKVERRWHGGRGLLNLVGHESVGAIVAEIEDTRHWHDGYSHDGTKIDTYADQPSSTLCISDCTRSIALTTYVGDGQDYENLLYKIDTMVEVLQGFREGLEVEYPRYLARREIADANEARSKEHEKLQEAQGQR